MHGARRTGYPAFREEIPVPLREADLILQVIFQITVFTFLCKVLKNCCVFLGPLAFPCDTATLFRVVVLAEVCVSGLSDEMSDLLLLCSVTAV